MISLYKPYVADTLPEMDDIFHSGRLAYGKWGKLFEEDLRSFLNVENLLTTNTYASAYEIALMCLGLKPGDEVIASPMCCLQSSMPLANYGLKIVWADIDPRTGTISPDDVSQKITKNTKLIVHNHYCGYPGHIDEINAIAHAANIKVIDDSIEAFGSKYKGKLLGKLDTDVTIFNFQTVRLPNTIDGGALVFKDHNLYSEALLRRDFGIRREIFRDTLGEISKDCDIYMKGIGATMCEPNSYLGHLCMQGIDTLLKKQKQNAETWKDKRPDLSSLTREEIEPNFWVYGIISEEKINQMISLRDEGYYASGVHLPNNFYSVFGERVELKGVSEFYNKFLALPCGWWM